MHLGRDEAGLIGRMRPVHVAPVGGRLLPLASAHITIRLRATGPSVASARISSHAVAQRCGVVPGRVRDRCRFERSAPVTRSPRRGIGKPR